MKLNYLYESLFFIVLILLQVLIFNQISILGYATPFVYIYFLLKLPIGRNVFYVIIIGFLMGLIIDIFLNTLGINAAAATLVATFRKPLLHLFYTKDEMGEHVPNINTETGAFIKFAIASIVIHQTALYTLESLSLFNPQILLLRWSTSILLSLILILAIDGLVHNKVTADE